MLLTETDLRAFDGDVSGMMSTGAALFSGKQEELQLRVQTGLKLRNDDLRLVMRERRQLEISGRGVCKASVLSVHGAVLSGRVRVSSV